VVDDSALSHDGYDPEAGQAAVRLQAPGTEQDKNYLDLGRMSKLYSSISQKEECPQKTAAPSLLWRRCAGRGFSSPKSGESIRPSPPFFSWFFPTKGLTAGEGNRTIQTFV
jgi:hypothetical protein